MWNPEMLRNDKRKNKQRRNELWEVKQRQIDLWTIRNVIMTSMLWCHIYLYLQMYSSQEEKGEEWEGGRGVGEIQMINEE